MAEEQLPNSSAKFDESMMEEYDEDSVGEELDEFLAALAALYLPLSLIH